MSDQKENVSDINTSGTALIETQGDGSAQEEKKESTMEELTQAVQTAAGFAENIVKRLWCEALHKDTEELFGEDGITDHIGIIRLEPREGSNAPGFALKLDLVPHDYQVDVAQFKNMKYVYDEMTRLISAAELYWQYCTNNYKLPQLDVWRSNYGTLYVAGTPPEISHIGIRVNKF